MLNISILRDIWKKISVVEKLFVSD